MIDHCGICVPNNFFDDYLDDISDLTPEAERKILEVFLLNHWCMFFIFMRYLTSNANALFNVHISQYEDGNKKRPPET